MLSFRAEDLSDFLNKRYTEKLMTTTEKDLEEYAERSGRDEELSDIS